MKTKSRGATRDELRPEYDLRALLKHGVQGKYAARCRKGTNLVLLDPEVAKAFPSASDVNEALRLVIRLTRLSAGGKRTAAKPRGAKVCG
jgi:hypothetical protein